MRSRRGLDVVQAPLSKQPYSPWVAVGSCGKGDSEKPFGWARLDHPGRGHDEVVGVSKRLSERAHGVEEAKELHQGLLRAAFRGRETRPAVLMTRLQRQWPV